MSDEYYEDVEDDSELDAQAEELELEDDDFEEELDLEEDSEASGEEEEDFEEITSDEVDRVIASLEGLLETVQSENIRTYLEAVVNKIFYLVYNDDDLEEGDEEDELSAEAA